jgi:hypothetical protein
MQNPPHRANPGALERQMQTTVPGRSPAGSAVLAGPTPDLNEWTLAAYHADAARDLRSRAKRLRAGIQTHGLWTRAECEKHARRHEEIVRASAYAAEKSSTLEPASRQQRARRVLEQLLSSGLPCADVS